MYSVYSSFSPNQRKVDTWFVFLVFLVFLVLPAGLFLAAHNPFQDIGPLRAVKSSA